MAYFETTPEFNSLIRKIETTDPAHADLFNTLVGALINNDVFLKNLTDQLLRAFEEHASDRQNPHGVSRKQLGVDKVNNTSDSEKPVSTAQRDALDAAYAQSTGYTDQKIANLINGAPSTLDTLGEVAKAMQDNQTVVAALNTAIGQKADTGHIHDDRYYTETEVNNLLSGKANSSHTHTKGDVGLGKVDNTADADKTVAVAQYAVQLSHLRNIKIGNQLNGFDGAHDISFDLNTIGAAPKEHEHNYLPLRGGSVTGDIEIQGQMMIGCGRYRFKCENQQSLYIFPYETEYALFFGVWNYWTVCPSVNGNLTLGTSWTRWGQPYFTASPNINSDRNLKNDIAPISDKYLEFFALLQPVTYRFKDGTSGRLHVGYISQDVEAAMEQVGLTDLDFAGFCKDKKQQEIRVKRSRSAVDANGNAVTYEYEEITWEDELDANGNPVYTYSLRYEEFIALHTVAIQRQQAKIDSLEKRLERLEQQCLQ